MRVFKVAGSRTLVIRLWPLALRWTWPVVTPGGYGCGQDTTQLGFSWPPGPRLPRWRQVDRRASWLDEQETR